MARRKANTSVKVNFKGVESRKTPPEGDYVVEVLEAVAGKSDNKNDQIEFTLEIAKGDYKGTKLWLYCPLLENSLWKLHAFLSALGVEVPEEEMDIDLSELVGKQCVGVITHDTYNGKKRAKMTDFDSIDNYKGGDADEDGGNKKKKKKDKKSKSDDGDADNGKKSKKDKGKKSKDDSDSKSDKKDKGKKDKKADKGKAKKKVAKSDVEDMDEDELQKLVDKHDLDDVDLDSIKKLGKKRAAVIEALDDADLLDDDE